MVIVFQPQSQKLPHDFATKLTLTIYLNFVGLDFVIFGQAFDTEPFSPVIKEVILSHGFHSWGSPTLASSAMLFCFLRNLRKKKLKSLVKSPNLHFCLIRKTNRTLLLVSFKLKLHFY